MSHEETEPPRMPTEESEDITETEDIFDSFHHWFSPSSSHRWLKCRASAIADKAMARDRDPFHADRGTFLHKVSEVCLEAGEDSALVIVEKEDDGDQVRWHLEKVRKIIGERLLEVASVFIPNCGGTADVVILEKLKDGTYRLWIIDAKFGKWKVFARHNTQLLIYLLGILPEIETLYGYKISEYRLVVSQPQLEHWDVWKPKQKVVDRWARTIKETVEGIKAGDAEFNPSEEACEWCDFKHCCPAWDAFAKGQAREEFSKLSEEVEELEDIVGEDAIPKKTRTQLETLREISALEPGEISTGQRYRLAKAIKKWAELVVDETRASMLKRQKVEGYKLVPGRNSYHWRNEESKAEAIEFLTELGIDRELLHTKPIPRDLVTPSAAKELIKGKGSKEMKEELDQFILPVPGKATIAPANDRRAEWNPKTDASEEFAEFRKEEND